MLALCILLAISSIFWMVTCMSSNNLIKKLQAERDTLNGEIQILNEANLFLTTAMQPPLRPFEIRVESHAVLFIQTAKDMGIQTTLSQGENGEWSIDLRSDTVEDIAEVMFAFNDRMSENMRLAQLMEG